VTFQAKSERSPAHQARRPPAVGNDTFTTTVVSDAFVALRRFSGPKGGTSRGYETINKNGAGQVERQPARSGARAL
jgi:hypothetical protein